MIDRFAGPKLLVVVWHMLTKEAVDRDAIMTQVAYSFIKLAYAIGLKNLPQVTCSAMDAV